ncbi:MAG TPA: hypothetical protein VJQ09_00980 [Candidatus Limnocylindria bacterium]|nr:hypothetical protein [Candidatus Limnocylindria bacterium]
MRSALALVSSAAILAAACGGAAVPSPSPSPTVKPLAVITITSPKGGEAVTAGTVVVTWEVSDVTLVPAASAQKPEDYHVHLAMDLDATQWIGKDTVVPAGDANPNPTRLIHSAGKTFSFVNVTAGEHTVTIWLSLASHVSVKPPVSASVKFTAR